MQPWLVTTLLTTYLENKESILGEKKCHTIKHQPLNFNGHSQGKAMLKKSTRIFNLRY